MAITVYLHVDRIDEGEASWWAESPDLPGFSAAADSMNELCARVQVAIDDLADEGELATNRVDFKLEETAATSGNPTRVGRSDQAPDLGASRPHARVLVS